MSEITTTTIALPNKEAVAREATGLLKTLIDATQNVTTPQAVFFVGGVTAVVGGGCYVFHETCDLIKGGFIECYDPTTDKVTFSKRGKTTA